MEGLLKTWNASTFAAKDTYSFKTLRTTICFLFFFPFHFPFFLFNIWWIMFPIPVPAEGNKELLCWSNGLFVTLMKYYGQLYHALATRCWRGPKSHPEALSWPITPLNMLLLPSRGCTSPASCPGGQAAHQSLGCAALSAHVSTSKMCKPCKKRKVGKKDRAVFIQNIIQRPEGSLSLFLPL